MPPLPPLSPFTHVLIVDEDENIRALYRHALETAAYPVYEAHDGAAALRVLRASVHPMVVLLNLWLPGLDGALMLAAVANEETLATRHVYVLVSSIPPARVGLLGVLLTRLHALVLAHPWKQDTLLATVAQAAARLPARVEQP